MGFEEAEDVIEDGGLGGGENERGRKREEEREELFGGDRKSYSVMVFLKRPVLRVLRGVFFLPRSNKRPPRYTLALGIGDDNS